MSRSDASDRSRDLKDKIDEWESESKRASSWGLDRGHPHGGGGGESPGPGGLGGSNKSNADDRRPDVSGTGGGGDSGLYSSDRRPDVSATTTAGTSQPGKSGEGKEKPQGRASLSFAIDAQTASSGKESAPQKDVTKPQAQGDGAKPQGKGDNAQGDSGKPQGGGGVRTPERSSDGMLRAAIAAAERPEADTPQRLKAPSAGTPTEGRPDVSRTAAYTQVSYRDNQKQASTEKDAAKQQANKEPTRIWTKAADPANKAEYALQERVRKGQVTPQEARRFFQAHEHPELRGLPHWDTARKIWVFPDQAGQAHKGQGAHHGKAAHHAGTGNTQGDHVQHAANDAKAGKIKGNVTADRKEQQPRPSTDYHPGQLDNKAGKNIEKERHKHTRAADHAASTEAKSATGKSTKVTGKGVEYHHHADVKESKRVGLNPDVAGEKNRMSALDSRRNPKHPSTIGDKSDPSKNPSRTPHNIAKSIDKEEQARTARAINKDSNPRLPANREGRKGLTDASAASKQRLPATADHAERAKHGWGRTQPKGPAVNARGEVIGSKAEGATAKMEKAEAKAQAVKPELRGVAGGAALIGLGIAAGLLESWVREKTIQSQLQWGFEQLDPEVKAKVEALGPEAAALQAEKPGAQLYANVTVQVRVMHELDDAGGDGRTWGYKPAAGFVQLSSVSLSTEPIDTAREGNREFGVAYYYEVRTITYSIPVTVQQPGPPVA